MTARRRIYFLSHYLMLAVGVIVTLIGNDLPEPWKALVPAIGTSVVAASGAGMLIWIYMSHVERGATRLNNMTSSGLEHIYDRRAAQIREEYASRLASARHKIDIMGFGLKDFRRDYISDLGALASRAEVRILLLDPDSEYSKQRDNEESQSEGTIHGEVNEFITQFKNNYPSPSEKLQVRLYDCLPLVNIFRIDGELFWGPYLVGKASGNTITLRVSQGGSVFEQLTEHFDNVWQRYSRELG